MKIALICSIISILVLVSMFMLNLFEQAAWGHGGGMCHDDGTRISHTMPDWWTHKADWDKTHRHYYPGRDYVGSYQSKDPHGSDFVPCTTGKDDKSQPATNTEPLKGAEITIHVPNGFSEHKIDIEPQRLADLLQEASPGFPHMSVWYQRNVEWWSFVLAGWDKFGLPNTGFYRVGNPRENFSVTIPVTISAAPGVQKRVATTWGNIKRGGM